jgi:L-threonylcarbamoyladenylate synthase
MTPVDQAVRLLRSGEVVAIPTETVYGLAADALNPAAAAKIFQIKGRPSFDPLIVHLPSLEALDSLAAAFPEKARRLADAFWPGALTLVLPKKPAVPDIVTSGLPSVAVRLPAHPLTRELLQRFGGPLAAPSANRFGRISPTTAQAVFSELGSAVPLILDGGPCAIGVESTIVSFTEEKPRLLRAGGISLEALEACIGPVTVAPTGSRMEAPGQLPSHYAPGKPLRLVDETELSALAPDPVAGLLGWGSLPSAGYGAVLNLSPEKSFTEAAANFFQMLRALDESPVKKIIALRLPDRDLGRAINDRLARASSR